MKKNKKIEVKKSNYKEKAYKIDITGNVKKDLQRVDLNLRVNDLIIEKLKTDKLFLNIETFLPSKPVTIILKDIEAGVLVIKRNNNLTKIDKLMLQNIIGSTRLFIPVKDLELNNFDEFILFPFRGKIVDKIKAINGNSMCFFTLSEANFSRNLKVKSLEIVNVENVWIGVGIYSPNKKTENIQIINSEYLSMNPNFFRKLPNNYYLSALNINYCFDNPQDFQAFVNEIKKGKINVNKIEIEDNHYWGVDKILKKDISVDDILKIQDIEKRVALAGWFVF